MSTNLNQRKKRGGAVWEEEFYTKGKKMGKKVPGFGMSKAQFTKEGVPRKARGSRSKLGGVDIKEKEKEMAATLGWGPDEIDSNMRQHGTGRGEHLQYHDTHTRQGYSGQHNSTRPDYLTKKGKVRVRATNKPKVGIKRKAPINSIAEPEAAGPAYSPNPLLASLGFDNEGKKKPALPPKPAVKRVMVGKRAASGKMKFYSKYKVGNTTF